MMAEFIAKNCVENAEICNIASRDSQTSQKMQCKKPLLSAYQNILIRFARQSGALKRGFFYLEKIK